MYFFLLSLVFTPTKQLQTDIMTPLQPSQKYLVFIIQLLCQPLQPPRFMDSFIHLGAMNRERSRTDIPSEPQGNVMYMQLQVITGIFKAIVLCKLLSNFISGVNLLTSWHYCFIGLILPLTVSGIFFTRYILSIFQVQLCSFPKSLFQYSPDLLPETVTHYPAFSCPLLQSAVTYSCPFSCSNHSPIPLRRAENIRQKKHQGSEASSQFWCHYSTSNRF